MIQSFMYFEDTNSVEITWADSKGVPTRCHSYSDAQIGDILTDLAEYGGDVSDYTAELDALRAAMKPPVPYIKPIPTVVSMRQARLALLRAGLLVPVNQAINVLPDVSQREALLIEWGYAQEIDRNSAFVGQIAATLNLSEAQLDALFESASTF